MLHKQQTQADCQGIAVAYYNLTSAERLDVRSTTRLSRRPAFGRLEAAVFSTFATSG
jgi:hypothetical protein